MLLAASPRSQRLGFLIIITIMSYTYSRLIFWLSKKQMARMSKMFLSQLCQALASPLCLEIQPICWTLSHFFFFFFWVLPGSCSEGRLNPAVWDGQPQMETLFHTSAAEEKSHFVFWVFFHFLCVWIWENVHWTSRHTSLWTILCVNWECNICLVTACFFWVFLFLFFLVNKPWSEHSQT